MVRKTPDWWVEPTRPYVEPVYPFNKDAVRLVKGRCRHCGQDGSLTLCKDCNVSPYCCREHELSMIVWHMSTECDRLKDAQVEVRNAHAALEGHELHSPNPWRWPSFQRYMDTKLAEVKILLDIETYEAQKAAREQSLWMLKFKDNLHVRSQVPVTFIRCGKEQELFDWLKWSVHCGDLTPIDDHRDPEFKDSDVFELFHGWECADLFIKFLLLLFKIKVLQDIRELRQSRDCQGRLFGVVWRRLEDAPDSTLDLLTGTIVDQIELLYVNISDANQHIWALFSRRRRLWSLGTPRPRPGSMKEAQFVLGTTHDAWGLIPAAGNEVLEDQARNWRAQGANMDSRHVPTKYSAIA